MAERRAAPSAIPAWLLRPTVPPAMLLQGDEPRLPAPQRRSDRMAKRAHPALTSLERVVLLALVVAAVLAAGLHRSVEANEAVCRFYRVQPKTLIVSDAPGGTRFIDMLTGADLVCVVGRERRSGRDWALVGDKRGPGARKPIGGWVDLRALVALTAAEARGLDDAVPPAAAQQAETSPPAAPEEKLDGAMMSNAPTKAAPTAASTATARGTMKDIPEDILFDQLLDDGPPEVKGHSIAELITSVPLVAPIPGMDPAAWQQPCSSCHKWDKAQLCKQGKVYAGTPETEDRNAHPFGTAFKIMLEHWAKGGCR
ncbi:hypothetical protein [Labrys wisconsinensis]|uniref:SH3 domain-containing protein n=1 Tax=Labrys wisconsinensis TaxID=425677 RepID=A0ABU0JDC6_9HYPH|nr:hypothetical protein [Labrys wisconsinensis]MDQ0472279.1 hypothetical protein [Labrys wisconsinensis]